jgi:hypothetical protein
MSLREKLPDDYEELKDIIELQYEEIKSLKTQNKINNLYATPYHISIAFKNNKKSIDK